MGHTPHFTTGNMRKHTVYIYIYIVIHLWACGLSIVKQIHVDLDILKQHNWGSCWGHDSIWPIPNIWIQIRISRTKMGLSQDLPKLLFKIDFAWLFHQKNWNLIINRQQFGPKVGWTNWKAGFKDQTTWIFTKVLDPIRQTLNYIQFIQKRG